MPTGGGRRVRLRTLLKLHLVVLCLAVGSAGASDSGTGLAWLKEALGPRSAAMGGVTATLRGEATGDNPASLSALEGKDFMVTHQVLFAGIRQEYAGAAFGNGHRGGGFGFAVRSSGGIERRTGPTTEPLGTFSVYDADFSVRYAQQVSRARVGGTFRILHETLESAGFAGVAFDLGAIVPLHIPHLTAGVVLRHLGRMRGPGSSSIRLPTSVDAGAGYATDLFSGRDRLVLSAEMSIPRHAEGIFRGGAEYSWRKQVSVRAGYQAGRDALGGSVGFGVQRRGLRFDYALTPYRYGLGNAHRVSVGFR